VSEKEKVTEETPKAKTAGESVGQAINSFVDTLEAAR
jgi:hypothetical protein